MKKVIVLGCGFAGLNAVKNIKTEDIKITVIDKNDYTTMVPALPDVASGFIDDDIIKYPISGLIPKKIEFIQDKVITIDLENKSVFCEKNSHEYDYLVITSGSQVNFFGFDQCKERLLSLSDVDDAIHIRKKTKEYLRASKQPVFVFSGAGYTGIELAINMLYFSKKNNNKAKIIMVEMGEKVLGFLREDLRKYVLDHTERLGIEIRTKTTVKSYDCNNVEFSDGTRVNNCLFFWTGGTKSTYDLKGKAPDSLSDGRIKVNKYLQIPEFKEVFVAGDSAAIEHKGNFLRKAVNFAFYSGITAGKNLSAYISGEQMKEYRPFDAGWVIPLHTKAIGNIMNLFFIKGRLPLRLHYFMCGIRNHGRNISMFIKRALILFNEETKMDRFKKFLFANDGDENIGLFIIRVLVAGFMMTHGYVKISGGLEGFTGFVAKMGFPAPAFFAFLSAFTESFGSLFLALGFMTRLWSGFFIVNMSVAAFVALGAAPFAKKELPLIYLAIYILFLFKGAGKYSLDNIIWKRLKK